MNINGKISGSKNIRLIAATRNKGKLEEIAQILKQFPFTVVSMTEAGVTDDIEETGSTFEGNALIKAKKVWEATGRGDIVLADDSGLEVDYLDGLPGVYSARYAGEGASDADRNRKLLGVLTGVPADKRSARFVCAMVMIFPDGRDFTVRGTCEGMIAFEPAGVNGFGYDPLFYIHSIGATIAQMDAETKNRISHRGNALRQLAERLKQIWRIEI